MPELLLELLSEEIPARMQARAADDLKRLIADGLKKDKLEFKSLQTFVTPRRLTLVVEGLPKKQAAKSDEKRGPRTDAPIQAIKGFMGSLPMGATKIERRETEKGEFFFAMVEQKEQSTAQFMPLIVETAIANLTWPKSMKWGNSDLTWVRPLRRILVIFDGKPIKGTIGLGTWSKIPGLVGLSPPDKNEKTISFSSETIGHSFLSPKPFKVKNFTDYKAKLENHYVILDAAERGSIIEKEAQKLAKKAKLKLKPDPALLDEIVGLVEWPVVLIGDIDESFMDLPREVLTTAMRHHQKYFALTDKKGGLAPRFIVVANTETKDRGKTVVAGNERVLRARLADAKFFWDQDRRRTLESRVGDLGGRVFHAKLGSVLDKAARVEKLAGRLAEACAADAETARRAARLAKADLSTEMVAEFPELQGVMGRYYALHDGEEKPVAEAIAEHYAPKGPNDSCPSAPVSVAVALADKLDSLTGFFAVDEKPTGSKDPFALRRAALGVIRLILENELSFSVRTLIEWAWETFPGDGDEGRLNAFIEDLRAFFFDRLKVHLRDKGVRHDLIDALFARGADDDLLRIVRKAEVLGRFLDTDDGANLLVAYRRANNIVRIEEKKDQKSYHGEPSKDFKQPEETALWEALERAILESGPGLEMAEFEGAVLALAGLRNPVDAFFDRVTVNVDATALRENRLKLLSQISETMNRVADFSRIEGGER
ncbi:MAG: glycine--tRNA ligase subunit beta [Proteobacteria bacterium]|nr:glycine--tRNA ligase subunit beta [Pseudomonadota bacterium]